MKVYRIVYEEDGEITGKPGKRATEIRRVELRYAASNIILVLAAIDWLLNDEEKTIIAIIEEAPAITILEGRE